MPLPPQPDFSPDKVHVGIQFAIYDNAELRIGLHDRRVHGIPSASPGCFCRAVTKHAVGIYDIPTACSSNRYDNAYAGIARLLGSSITMLHATENLFLNKSNLQNKPRGSLPHCALSCPTGTLLSAVLPPRCSRFGSTQEAATASGTELFVTLLADTDLTSERIGKRDKGFGLGDTRYA